MWSKKLQVYAYTGCNKSMTKISLSRINIWAKCTNKMKLKYLSPVHTANPTVTPTVQTINWNSNKLCTYYKFKFLICTGMAICSHLSLGTDPWGPAIACHRECWRQTVGLLSLDLLGHAWSRGLDPDVVALISSTREVMENAICTSESET